MNKQSGNEAVSIAIEPELSDNEAQDTFENTCLLPTFLLSVIAGLTLFGLLAAYHSISFEPHLPNARISSVFSLSR